jgi:PAS domain S-box-containing protein
MLHAVLLTVFATHAALLLFGAPFIFARKIEGGILMAVVLLAAAFAWGRMRHGAIALASHVIAWTLWIVYSAILLLADPANVGLYIPVVFIAAMLLGPAWAIAIGFSGAAIAALAIFGGDLGVNFPHFFPVPPASRFLFFITQTILAVVPFYVIGRNLTLALDHVRGELAEKALQESESRYRAMIATMAEGTMLRDMEGNLLLCNPAAERIIGLKAAEMGRWSFPLEGWRTIREDGSPFPHDEHPVMITMRTGRPCSTVVMGFQPGAGALKWISINSVALRRDNEDKPYAVLTTLSDITERKQAQQMLDRERALLRTLVDHLPDDVVILDTAGRFTMVNPAWLAQHGFATDEGVVGCTAIDLFDASLAAQVDAENNRIIETGIGLYNQSRVVPKADGGTRWVLISKIPMRDRDGKIVGVISIIRDVTELKNALDTLQQERNLLRAIIDSAPDAIYVKDREGRYVIMNKAGLRFRGVEDHDDIVGKTAHDYFPADVVLGIDKEDSDIMNSGQPLIDSQRRSVEPRGGNRWISTSKFPLTYGAGAVVGLVTINRDITELRNIIEEVRSLNVQLEGRVRMRTLELQETNKELEAFSYSVSHDLRAPLRSISGFGGYLLKDNYEQLDAEGKSRLQRILAASERMGELIDDLLMLARISRQAMSLRKVNLHALAHEAIAALREASPQRPVDVSIAPDLKIEADAGLMRVVVDNLLGNAWKFTGKRPDARIEVGFANIDGAGAYFVRDNGAGFDMGYAGKLFAPFQRMHTQQQFEGTGIGLATVKRIVERHQGRIWIESAVNRGTTVYFTVGGSA